MSLLRVNGESHLYRDENSTAIINTNKNEYVEYIEAKERKLKELNEISDLKREVSELKGLVYQLIEKL
jgi:hypothetical protein